MARESVAFTLRAAVGILAPAAALARLGRGESDIVAGLEFLLASVNGLRVLL